MTTCRTPMKSAAARCSSARFLASAAGVSDRSAVPAAPLVHSTYVTSHPAAAHLATTPPEPISASSGCAKITIALSGISVTIPSLGGVASLGMGRFYRSAEAPAPSGTPKRYYSRHYDDQLLSPGSFQSPRPDPSPGRPHVRAATGRLGSPGHQDRDARRAHGRRHGRQSPRLRFPESPPQQAEHDAQPQRS